MMIEIRVHGRGGQGVVTAAELLSVAAFLDGRQALALPSFGSERMGAPVVAYCRIDDAPIRARDPVAEPHAVIIQDPTLLLQQADAVFSGLRAPGHVLINTTRLPRQLPIPPAVGLEHVVAIPASRIAQDHIGRPVPNAALLGAFAALTGWVSIDSVLAAIGARFSPPIAAGNEDAAREAFSQVRMLREEPAHA